MFEPEYEREHPTIVFGDVIRPGTTTVSCWCSLAIHTDYVSVFFSRDAASVMFAGRYDPFGHFIEDIRTVVYPEGLNAENLNEITNASCFRDEMIILAFRNRVYHASLANPGQIVFRLTDH